MTPEERKALYMKISELSGDNEQIMESLAELQKDDVERGNNSTAYSDSDVQDTDGVRWEQKYLDMKAKYRERFFSGYDEAGEPSTEPEPEPEPDNISFDSLFKKE